MPIIEDRLIIKSEDVRWTKVAKLTINSIMDYADSINRFRTIRMGEHASVDERPGCYIMFPEFSGQKQSGYQRTENVFVFDMMYAIKDDEFFNALSELLEIHGLMQKSFQDNPTMALDPPLVEVPETFDIELVGLTTGSETIGTGHESYEYLYGRTLIRVKTIINPRG